MIGALIYICTPFQFQATATTVHHNHFLPWKGLGRARRLVIEGTVMSFAFAPSCKVLVAPKVQSFMQALCPLIFGSMKKDSITNASLLPFEAKEMDRALLLPKVQRFMQALCPLIFRSMEDSITQMHLSPFDTKEMDQALRTAPNLTSMCPYYLHRQRTISLNHSFPLSHTNSDNWVTHTHNNNNNKSSIEPFSGSHPTPLSDKQTKSYCWWRSIDGIRRSMSHHWDKIARWFGIDRREIYIFWRTWLFQIFNPTNEVAGRFLFQRTSIAQNKKWDCSRTFSFSFSADS